MSQLGWTRLAGGLEGPGFARFQAELTRYNSRRFQPGLPTDAAQDDIAVEAAVASAEIAFLEVLTKEIAPLTRGIPDDTDGFIGWFEALKHSGPGQGNPLFPWLAT